jgi:hypothetical protein
MKPYERRAANAYPYYKLAEWDERNTCWKDGKQTFERIGLAMAAARKPGRYRISAINDAGRRDLEPFNVT